MQQNAATAIATAIMPLRVTASGVKNSGATTKAFLTHWRGGSGG